MLDVTENKRGVLLLVDDSPLNLEVLYESLFHDYDIKTATNGVEALTVAENNEIDLILLDVMMPNMDGYEVCHRLKQDPKTRSIPVIFITSKSDPTDEEKGFSVGAVDFIQKPYKIPCVQARVKLHFDLKRAQDAVVRQNKMRNELLHLLSHDLAGPLWIANSNFERFVNDPPQLDKLKGSISRGLNNSLQILKFTRDYLAFEDGKFRFELKPYCLRDLVFDSIILFQERFDEKGIMLKVDVDDKYIVHVERASFINSVLNNLLSNALKFSYPGTQVSVFTLPKDQGAELVIKDQGVGIETEHLNSLFDLEKSYSLPGTLGEKGNGFGLPLVKKFLEAFNGKIYVKSETDGFNKGTEFHLVWLK